MSDGNIKYLLEQLEFFKIPVTAISIHYDGEYDERVYEVLKSLALNQIFLATSNLEIIKNQG